MNKKVSKFVVSARASSVEAAPLLYRNDGERIWQGLKDQREFFTPLTEGVQIKRGSGDGNAYLMNCGPRVLFVSYWKFGDGGELEQVGPRYDCLHAGQFREVGAGPGIVWHVEGDRYE